MNEIGIERALIARGISGAVVMATDGACMAAEIERLGTAWVHDVFGDDEWLPARPGLYLWEGHPRYEAEPGRDTLDGPIEPGDPYLLLDGTTRPVRPEEIGELLAMKPATAV